MRGGIFPTPTAVLWPVSMVLMEQHDAWQPTGARSTPKRWRCSTRRKRWPASRTGRGSCRQSCVPLRPAGCCAPLLTPWTGLRPYPLAYIRSSGSFLGRRAAHGDRACLPVLYRPVTETQPPFSTITKTHRPLNTARRRRDQSSDSHFLPLRGIDETAYACRR